jgi:hypothetical protein
MHEPAAAVVRLAEQAGIWLDFTLDAWLER